MERNTLITILLVGLVILAGAQAMEINGIKSSGISKISGYDDSGSTSSQATRYSAPSTSSPSMVGGC